MGTSTRRLVVRSAVLAGYADVARTFGLDPAALARRAGLSLRALVAPDTKIAARRAIRLLEISARVSGVETFGLTMARAKGLSHLGLLGLLARDEPDLRSALRRIIDGIELHSTCIALDLDEQRGVATVGMTILPDGERLMRQAVELALAQLFQNLRQLLGADWRPLRVQFVHPVGSSDRPHRALFGCPVQFSAERSAIVMRSSDLDRPMPGADVGFRAYADSLQAVVPIGCRATAAQVRQVLIPLLSAGRGTSRAVAASLGMDRRTLHRHLAEEQVGFSELLAGLRRELAEQYLEADARRCAEIGTLLGFHAPSSFSRWFAGEFGATPAQWRRRAGR